MKTLEAIFWSVGTMLMLIFFGAHAWGEIERQRGIAALGETQQSGSDQVLALETSSPALIKADPGYRQPPGDEVLAILRAAGIGLELPVRHGTYGQATPFRQLRTADRINLYVPANEYEFSTLLGFAREQLAKVVVPERLVVAQRTVAQTTTPPAAHAESRPAVLSATASFLPRFALAGFLSLLGGMILRHRR